MLSYGKCGARIADYDQCAVSIIIANVVAHVWFDGKAQKPLVAIQFALGKVAVYICKTKG